MDKYEIDLAEPKPLIVLPCVLGQHNWADTGMIIKTWSSNRSNDNPPEDCDMRIEQECLICKQTRWI